MRSPLAMYCKLLVSEEKLPAPGLMLQTCRHSSDYVVVFINYVVVYKNCVTVYIDYVAV